MFPPRLAHPLPVRPRRALLCVLATLALVLAAVTTRAQATQPLPSAPTPQLVSVQYPANPGFAQPFPDAQQAGSSTPSGALSPVAPNAEEAAPQEPLVTISARHGNNRYWLSGQANIIFQGRLPFHSRYQGTNSFHNSAEYKTSLLGTLYTALRPTHSIRYNTDLILDLESSGGRGLSQALGLAGFTNLDVVRNPNLGSVPYLARYGFTRSSASPGRPPPRSRASLRWRPACPCAASSSAPAR